MTLAHAMEHVRLHRRLALFVLSFVGSSIKWFEMFGKKFQLLLVFLSNQ